MWKARYFAAAIESRLRLEISRGRRRTATALMALAALALGCAERRADGDIQANRGYVTVVKDTAASWIRNFNPFLATSLWPSASGIYEPMIVFNVMSGEYEAFLAEKYAFTSDNRSLRFQLRRGVEWSDGRPFTAADVVFTFELIRKYAALDQFGARKFLQHFAAVDDYTVEFRFTQPRVGALPYIGHQPIVPEHIWKSIEDPVRFTNDEPVATGPFTEVEVFRSQIYQLGRNPRYWQSGKPYIQGLRLPAFPGNEAATLALLDGEIDWAGLFVPAIDRVYVERDPEHFHYWFPLVDGTVLLYANTTRKPFDDARVRKALSLSIDRELMVKVASFGYTRPSDPTGLSDAYARFRDPEALETGDWVSYDPARAERLFDEAGLRRGADGLRRGTDGAPLSYEVNVVDGWNDWMRAGQIIANGLRSVGLRAGVKQHTLGSFYDRLQRGDFDLSLGWSFVLPTPEDFYRHLMGGDLVKPVGEPTDRNWHRYRAEGADELIAVFDRSSDPAEQRRVAALLQKLFIEHAPAIPLFPGPAWGQYNDRRVSGFPNRDNPYARLAPHAIPDSLLVMTRLRPR